MAKSELVYEFQGSRNLNTNPIDITGLQGDVYDYELVTWFDVEGAGSRLDMNFNNDITSNYRYYSMRGDGSTASAAVNDSISYMPIDANNFSYTTLSLTSIKGSSGAERYISTLTSYSVLSGDTRVAKISNYWKNTANVITSIQLTKSASVTSTCHILLYRTLKAASQGNWEKVDELSWSAESTEKSFTVDGDRDKKYRIVIDSDSTAAIDMRINSDSGSNYIRQYLRNGSGTLVAGNATDTDFRINGSGEVILNAETGVKRLSTSSGSKITSWQQTEDAHWYTNTATNITSININVNATTFTGTATLYRMKSGTETDGVLPWELVEEVDVSGDFSSGYSFNNLTGDSEKLYRLEWLGSNTTTAQSNINFRPNADSGSNYTRQYLRGRAATASAGSGTLTQLELSGNDDGEMSTGSAYLYPKSGSARPSLRKHAAYSTTSPDLWHQAQWWSNTADEITSIFAFGASADVLNGKLKLWRLK